MNKIKVIGLGLFFSLFFVACGGSSSSSPTPDGDGGGGGELGSQTLSASSELIFTYGETSFKTLEVTSDEAGKGKYSVTNSDNPAAATAISNSVGLVRVTPKGVGETTITVKREEDTSYDSAETKIKIIVEPQDQNLKVNLGTTTSNRWKLSKGTTATISVAAKSVGGVGGDGVLVGSEKDYSVENSHTGVVIATVDKAADIKFGELTIEALTAGDATVTVSNPEGKNYKEGKVVIFITVNEDATQAALNFTSTDGSTTDVTFDGYGETASKTITVTGSSAGVSVKSSYEQVVRADFNGGLITITPLSSGTAVITVTRQGGTDGTTPHNPISKDIRVTVNKPAAETLRLSEGRSSFTKDYNEGVDTTSSMVSGSSSTSDYYIESSKKGQGDSRIIAATASITSSGAITVTFEDAGTTDIIITRAGNSKYRSSSSATIDVTVNKASQQLTANFLRVDGDGDGVATNITNEGFETSYTSLARRALFIVKGQGDGPFNKNPIITNNTDENVNEGVVTKAVIGTELYNNQGNKEFFDNVLELTLDQAGTTDIIVEKQGDHNYLAGKFTGRVRIDKAGHKISIEGNETDFELKKDTVAKVRILGAKGDGDYTTPPLVVSTPVAPAAPVVASASIAGNELTLTALELGSAVVTFRKNGDRNYATSNEVTIDVEVTTLENQVITSTKSKFTALYADEIPTQDTEISITPSGASDADGVYDVTSSSPKVATATINNETNLLTVTFHNAGETTLFVRRLAVDGFNASRTLGIKVTVEQATQTITVANDNFVLNYGDTTTTILTGGKVSYAHYIESVIPDEGVVSATLRYNTFNSVNTNNELNITAVGSGTAKISVYNYGDGRNYKQSNTLTITVKVNRAAQKLRARPSTFSLVYNDTATSTITTDAVVRFDDEGKYVVSNNTNIVTTDIDPKSGLLSLRAVGVTDTTVTITITKEEDSRYKAATIEIPITKVIRADQPLTSSVIGRLSFDKPGDTTTVTISDGLSNATYTAISDNTAIVTAAITTAGSLSIEAVAAGSTIVRIARATGDNYNAADLTIQVRVKKQQTLLAVGAVLSFKYKDDERQSVANITGGQGTGGYQASSTPTDIVNTSVNADGVLFITTVSTGDTTISIHKEGDNAYNQSDPILLSVSVARGVVPLEYKVINDATTIKYSSAGESIIKLILPTDIRESDFTYTATTSDNEIVGGDAKIRAELEDDASIKVTTVNADPQPAIITVTRARTPYYDEATAVISVTVEKADLALAYDNPSPVLVYKINGDATTVRLAEGQAIAETSFIYTTGITNNAGEAEGAYTVLDTPIVLLNGNLTVTADNASPISPSTGLPIPTIIRVTRTGDSNYNTSTIDISVTVEKATLALVYDGPPTRSFTYKIVGDATTVRLAEGQAIAGVDFTYRVKEVLNAVQEDSARVLDVPSVGTELPNGNFTVMADNFGRLPVGIRVERLTTRNYNYAISSVLLFQVNKANLPNIDYKYSGTTTPIPSSGEVTVTFDTEVSIEPTSPQSFDFTISAPVDAVLGQRIDSNGTITIVSGQIDAATLTLSWSSGLNYEGSRTFTVTTSKKTPTFAYDSPIVVELTFATSADVMETQDSIEDIRSADRGNVMFSVSGRAGIVDIDTEVISDKIRITPKGLGTTTLTVTKTFVGDAADYYNEVSTDITVNVSGVQLAHKDTTDITLGAYSGLTVINDASLFIAGQSISGREVGDDGTFGSTTIGDNITTSAADSITSAKLGDKTYIFTANRQKSEVRVYSVASDGDLSSVTVTSDSPDLAIGGASALTTAIIEGSLFLFVAGSTDDGLSVFEVTNDNLIYDDGDLIRAGKFFDGGPLELGYTLDGASALTTAIIDNTTTLFVAGKDENAVGVYKPKYYQGTIITLAHEDDSNIRDITGALSLATVSTDTKFFLYAAGTTGVKQAEVKVTSDGVIIEQGTQILNSSDKDTFVTVAQKGATNFLFAAYGNRLEAYVIDDNDGVLQTTSKVTYIDNDDSKFDGVSSLTTTTIKGRLFLFVAGSSDNGVSVFEVRYLP